MSNQPPPYISPEVQQYIDLGRQGKLWAIGIPYKNSAGETKYVVRWNMTGRELMELRRGIFVYGLTLCVAPHEWVVIPPKDIGQCNLTRQTAYLPDKPAGYTGTEFKENE